jgi:hypothetical protein
MPKRIVVASIGLPRNGKTWYPTIGKLEEFSAEELKQLGDLEKLGGQQLVRKPVNEDPTAGQDSGSGSNSGSDKPLAERTVPEIKKYAVDHNIDIGDASSKADILAKITAAEADL